MFIKTTRSPKQIIVDHKGQAAPWPYPYDFSVRYVRVDLIENLIGALEELCNYAESNESRHLTLTPSLVKKIAKNALKTLEEE